MKTYKEWTFIHKINVPIKDNANLNERWDTCNHLFYKKVLNSDLYPKDNNVSNDYKIHQGKFKLRLYIFSYITKNDLTFKDYIKLDFNR